MKEIDVRSLACPGPVLKLRDLLDAGEREIAMHVGDELCRSNVTRFAASRNADVDVEDPGDGTFVGQYHRGEDSGSARAGEEAFMVSEVSEGGVGPRVVQITASTMGTGDDELGALLLRSFLKTQAELERKPDAILFYNDGVKLCCEGSTLLDDLRGLEGAGSRSSLAAPASTSSSSPISCGWAGSPTCSKSPACWPTRDRSSAP